MTKKNNLFLRSIASILVISFAFSELAHSAALAETKSVSSVDSKSALNHQGTSFQAPLLFSNLKEIHRGSSDKLIIHIQDAHANFSGQANLASTLDYLLKKYKTNLILVEGSAKDSNLDLVRDSIPTAKQKPIAKHLLYEGKIAGEEYLNLTSKHPMKIRGVEYWDLYLESIKQYSELAIKRKSILEYLEKIRTALDKLKKNYYPKELLEYEVSSKEDQYKLLLGLAHKKNLDLSNYPDISKLNQLNTSEGLINFEKVSLEQASLLEKLMVLAPEKTKAILENIALSKYNKVALQGAYQTLLLFAQENDLNLKNYSTLSSYQDYLRNFNQIDFKSLLDQMQAMEEKVYLARLETLDAKLIHSIDRYVQLLEKAYKIQMTSDEFNLFLSAEPDFATEKTLAFLNRKLGDLNYFESIVPYKNYFEEANPSLKNFYESVNKRDLAFMENAERIMSHENENVAILITGGYHTQHLKELFEAKGYSYAILTPHVTQETNQAKYEKLLLEPFGSKQFTITTNQDHSFRAQKLVPEKVAMMDEARLTALLTEVGLDKSRMSRVVGEIGNRKANQSVGARLANRGKGESDRKNLRAQMLSLGMTEEEIERQFPGNDWSMIDARGLIKGLRELKKKSRNSMGEAQGARLSNTEQLEAQRLGAAQKLVTFVSGVEPSDREALNNYLWTLKFIHDNQTFYDEYENPINMTRIDAAKLYIAAVKNKVPGFSASRIKADIDDVKARYKKNPKGASGAYSLFVSDVLVEALEQGVIGFSAQDISDYFYSVQSIKDQDLKASAIAIAAIKRSKELGLTKTQIRGWYETFMNAYAPAATEVALAAVAAGIDGFTGDDVVRAIDKDFDVGYPVSTAQRVAKVIRAKTSGIDASQVERWFNRVMGYCESGGMISSNEELKSNILDIPLAAIEENIPGITISQVEAWRQRLLNYKSFSFSKDELKSFAIKLGLAALERKDISSQLMPEQVSKWHKENIAWPVHISIDLTTRFYINAMRLRPDLGLKEKELIDWFESLPRHGEWDGSPRAEVMIEFLAAGVGKYNFQDLEDILSQILKRDQIVSASYHTFEAVAQDIRGFDSQDIRSLYDRLIKEKRYQAAYDLALNLRDKNLGLTQEDALNVIDLAARNESDYELAKLIESLLENKTLNVSVDHLRVWVRALGIAANRDERISFSGTSHIVTRYNLIMFALNQHIPGITFDDFKNWHHAFYVGQRPQFSMPIAIAYAEYQKSQAPSVIARAEATYESALNLFNQEDQSRELSSLTEFTSLVLTQPQIAEDAALTQTLEEIFAEHPSISTLIGALPQALADSRLTEGQYDTAMEAMATATLDFYSREASTELYWLVEMFCRDGYCTQAQYDQVMHNRFIPADRVRYITHDPDYNHGVENIRWGLIAKRVSMKEWEDNKGNEKFSSPDNASLTKESRRRNISLMAIAEGDAVEGNSLGLRHGRIFWENVSQAVYLLPQDYQVERPIGSGIKIIGFEPNYSRIFYEIDNELVSFCLHLPRSIQILDHWLGQETLKGNLENAKAAAKDMVASSESSDADRIAELLYQGKPNEAVAYRAMIGAPTMVMGHPYAADVLKGLIQSGKSTTDGARLASSDDIKSKIATIGEEILEFTKKNKEHYHGNKPPFNIQISNDDLVIIFPWVSKQHRVIKLPILEINEINFYPGFGTSQTKPSLYIDHGHGDGRVRHLAFEEGDYAKILEDQGFAKHAFDVLQANLGYIPQYKSADEKQDDEEHRRHFVAYQNAIYCTLSTAQSANAIFFFYPTNDAGDGVYVVYDGDVMSEYQQTCRIYLEENKITLRHHNTRSSENAGRALESKPQQYLMDNGYYVEFSASQEDMSAKKNSAHAETLSTIQTFFSTIKNLPDTKKVDYHFVESGFGLIQSIVWEIETNTNLYNGSFMWRPGDIRYATDASVASVVLTNHLLSLLFHSDAASFEERAADRIRMRMTAALKNFSNISFNLRTTLSSRKEIHHQTRSQNPWLEEDLSDAAFLEVFGFIGKLCEMKPSLLYVANLSNEKEYEVSAKIERLNIEIEDLKNKIQDIEVLIKNTKTDRRRSHQKEHKAEIERSTARADHHKKEIRDKVKQINKLEPQEEFFASIHEEETRAVRFFIWNTTRFANFFKNRSRPDLYAAWLVNLGKISDFFLKDEARNLRALKEITGQSPTVRETLPDLALSFDEAVSFIKSQSRGLPLTDNEQNISKNLKIISERLKIILEKISEDTQKESEPADESGARLSKTAKHSNKFHRLASWPSQKADKHFFGPGHYEDYQTFYYHIQAPQQLTDFIRQMELEVGVDDTALRHLVVHSRWGVESYKTKYFDRYMKSLGDYKLFKGDKVTITYFVGYSQIAKFKEAESVDLNTSTTKGVRLATENGLSLQVQVSAWEKKWADGIASKRNLSRILIVDDYPDDRDLVAGYIKQSLPKATIELFDSPDKVLEKDLSGYDLIIIDKDMPQMSGMQMIDRIRQNEIARGIPEKNQAKIILNTGGHLDKIVKDLEKFGLTLGSLGVNTFMVNKDDRTAYQKIIQTIQVPTGARLTNKGTSFKKIATVSSSKVSQAIQNFFETPGHRPKDFKALYTTTANNRVQIFKMEDPTSQNEKEQFFEQVQDYYDEFSRELSFDLCWVTHGTDIYLFSVPSGTDFFNHVFMSLYLQLNNLAVQDESGRILTDKEVKGMFKKLGSQAGARVANQVDQFESIESPVPGHRLKVVLREATKGICRVDVLHTRAAGSDDPIVYSGVILRPFNPKFSEIIANKLAANMSTLLNQGDSTQEHLDNLHNKELIEKVIEEAVVSLRRKNVKSKLKTNINRTPSGGRAAEARKEEGARLSTTALTSQNTRATVFAAPTEFLSLKKFAAFLYHNQELLNEAIPYQFTQGYTTLRFAKKADGVTVFFKNLDKEISYQLTAEDIQEGRQALKVQPIENSSHQLVWDVIVDQAIGEEKIVTQKAYWSWQRMPLDKTFATVHIFNADHVNPKTLAMLAEKAKNFVSHPNMKDRALVYFISSDSALEARLNQGLPQLVLNERTHFVYHADVKQTQGQKETLAANIKAKLEKAGVYLTQTPKFGFAPFNIDRAEYSVMPFEAQLVYADIVARLEPDELNLAVMDTIKPLVDYLKVQAGVAAIQNQENLLALQEFQAGSAAYQRYTNLAVQALFKLNLDQFLRYAHLSTQAAGVAA